MKFLVNGVEVEPAESFTLGEMRVFKRVAGVRLDEIDDLMGDPGSLIAFVLVSAMRDPRCAGVTEADVEAIDIGALIVSEPGDDDAPEDAAPLGEQAAAAPSVKPRGTRAAKA